MSTNRKLTDEVKARNAFFRNRTYTPDDAETPVVAKADALVAFMVERKKISYSNEDLHPVINVSGGYGCFGTHSNPTFSVGQLLKEALTRGLVENVERRYTLTEKGHQLYVGLERELTDYLQTVKQREEERLQALKANKPLPANLVPQRLLRLTLAATEHPFSVRKSLTHFHKELQEVPSIGPVMATDLLSIMVGVKTPVNVSKHPVVVRKILGAVVDN